MRRILAGARRLGAVVVDAADMGARPDELRLLDEGLIAEQPFLTTHKLPLIFLPKLLREFVPIVQLLSIQPALVAFSYPMSPEVRRAVELIHKNLTKVADGATGRANPMTVFSRTR